MKYKIKKIFESFIYLTKKQSYWTSTIGVSRSILAFGTMLTLMTNSVDTLFFFGIDNEIQVKCDQGSFFSIFCLLSENLILAKWISILILVFVVIGFLPRITGVLHWWISFSFFSSSHVIDGGDQVTAVLTFLLIPICLFDNRVWHFQNSENNNYYINTIAFFSICLIKLQVFGIYFDSVFAKLGTEAWINGTALYYWSNSPYFFYPESLRSILNFVFINPFVMVFSTWGVLILEGLLAFMIFKKNSNFKKNIFYLGVFLHLFIAVFYGLSSFFLAMTAALLLSYYGTSDVLNIGFNTKAFRNNIFSKFYFFKN